MPVRPVCDSGGFKNASAGSDGSSACFCLHASICEANDILFLVCNFSSQCDPPILLRGAETGKFVSAQMQYCCLMCIYCKFHPSDGVNMHKFKTTKSYSLYENEMRAFFFEISCSFPKGTGIFYIIWGERFFRKRTIPGIENLSAKHDPCFTNSWFNWRKRLWLTYTLDALFSRKICTRRL